MSQIPTFKIHPPKTMTGQRCQCQCQNPPKGKLAVCRDGTVGSLDPELVLCDVCFFELKEVNHLRHTSYYLHSIDTSAAIPEIHWWTSCGIGVIIRLIVAALSSQQSRNTRTGNYHSIHHRTDMCKIIIRYDCGCKPYVGIKPCSKPGCEKVERVNEPPCALCVKEELEIEQQRSYTK
ncbi:hypothetical protein F5B17DRAFT_431453 [Nemania serpens]|nr:hypothetical protein F5B17DRAFT_431453 [Nemania serpens]